MLPFLGVEHNVLASYRERIANAYFVLGASSMLRAAVRGKAVSAHEAELQWYFARNGQQFGPIGDAELRRHYGAGDILPSDYVWCADMENWTEAQAVLGPRRPLPPPLPQTSPRQMGDARIRGSASNGTIHEPQQLASPAPRHGEGMQSERALHVTETVIEGGSFKLSTLLFLILGLIVPLWPISLPVFWYLAYRSYQRPDEKKVRVVTEYRQ